MIQSQNMDMQGQKRVPTAEFAAKFASKRECFNFLSVDCGAYLCSHETLTVYFLRELIAGTKKRKTDAAVIILLYYRYQLQQSPISVRTRIQRFGCA